MALLPVFHGHVSDDGQLEMVEHEQRVRRNYLRLLAGEDVEVTVRKARTKRSLEQNAYWHAGPFPILADYFGCTIPEVKLALMGECWGYHRDKVTGREFPIKPHTSEMTVEEGTYFTDWLIPWAMTEHGVALPLPSEVVAA